MMLYVSPPILVIPVTLDDTGFFYVTTRQAMHIIISIPEDEYHSDFSRIVMAMEQSIFHYGKALYSVCSLRHPYSSSARL